MIGTLVKAQTQNLLIQGSSTLPESLTTQEQLLFEQIQEFEFVEQSSLVEIGDLASSISQGSVLASIPLIDCGNITFKTKFAEYETPENYRWEGELVPLDSCQCGDGYLTLVAQEGHKIGHLTIDTNYFEIRELSEKIFVISKLSFENFSGKECGIIADTSGFSPPVVGDREEENCEVRVLVLYNQSTIDADGSVVAIGAKAHLAMWHTEMALKNSAVADNQLHIVLAGVVEIPNHTQTNNDAQLELNALSTDDVFVKPMRDLVGADIVVFLTGDDYELSGNDTYGVAGTLVLEPEKAYCLVETQAATSRYTFTHELAHIFGCRHNIESDATSGIMHGYELNRSCGARHTIMHLIGKNQARILHFSNPHVKYAGKVTGTAEQEYNAQQLRNTSCTVAEFRTTNNNILTVQISGERVGCICTTANLSAVLGGGVPGTYEFEWSLSQDGGVTYGSVESTSSTFQPDFPCPDEGSYTIRLKVTDPNGQIVYRFTAIEGVEEIPGGDPCGHGGGNRPSFRSKFNQGEVLMVSPNPATEEVRITFTSDINQVQNIKIISASGRIMFDNSSYISREENSSMQISTGNWDNGIYYATIKGKNGPQIVKFAILN